MASSAISTPTRMPMPARISRGLSLKGRRGCGVRAGPPARLGVIDVTVAGIVSLVRGWGPGATCQPRPRSLLRVQEILQLVRELVDIAEMTIHRRKAHVGDLVQLFELLHDEGPDVVGGDLFLLPVLEGRLHTIRNRFERRDADGALLARFQQPATNFWRSNRSRLPSFFTTMYGIS